MYQLGIDVSKATLDICLLLDGIRGRIKTKKVKNDYQAVHIILTWLQQQNCRPEDVHTIMEATGVYHELIVSISAVRPAL
ncbi:IS110 family transposase [Yersinia enterocolitica]|uniref:IS110 family transposase n=1 Tax=Yersinia enterocolitica TaxID=630 RepID=UPI00398D61E1